MFPACHSLYIVQPTPRSMLDITIANPALNIAASFLWQNVFKIAPLEDKYICF